MGIKLKFMKINIKLDIHNQAPMSHFCNPSYFRNRDQEDHSLKPIQANRPYLEKTLHKKRVGGVA
jgi:hypothetical protein